MTQIIYRLLSQESWQTALAEGTFRGSEHDQRDGFIHFSSAEQVAETARRHYVGQPELLLLYVRAAELGEALKWEPSRGGALFPHLYGPLDTRAVFRVEALALTPNGEHALPADLPRD